MLCKVGCQEVKERTGPLKMLIAVGMVMGLHAGYEIFFGGVEFDLSVILRYLPVSAAYIGSMLIGYFGLRYIELSISSPLCSSAGAIVVLLMMIRGERPTLPMGIAILLTVLGVIGLGIAEYTEDEVLRAERQKASNHLYAKSAIAIALPLLYALIDALGTFGDSIVLDSLGERQANVAYELTFLATGLVVLIYLLATGKFKFNYKLDVPKILGAVTETAGQFAYIFALAAKPLYAAPLIACYSILSVVWSGIFLKEKLSWKHYVSVALAMAGVVLLGIFNPDA